MSETLYYDIIKKAGGTCLKHYIMILLKRRRFMSETTTQCIIKKTDATCFKTL